MTHQTPCPKVHLSCWKLIVATLTDGNDKFFGSGPNPDFGLHGMPWAFHGRSMEPEDDCVKWWRCAPTTPGFHSTKPMDVYSNLLTRFWCTSPANTNHRPLLFHGIPWKSTVCHGKSWKSKFGHGPKNLASPLLPSNKGYRYRFLASEMDFNWSNPDFQVCIFFWIKTNTVRGEYN